MIFCYYPTSTIAIDDDAEFLTTLMQHLGIQNCISYSNPNKAVETILKQKSYHTIESRLLKVTPLTDELNSINENDAFTFNVHSLHEEIYNPKRFTETSVILVDYHMDGISGIDVCEQLINHPAKKILLTGGPDKEKVAIEAFNKGIIHRFISKTDPNFVHHLQQTISVLKEAYFRDLTSKMLPYISPEKTRILLNPSYINFVKNLQIQFNAIEYYLLDTSGSFLFFDKNGNPTWLIIKNKSELENYGTIALEQDADIGLIKLLQSGKQLPFFFSPDDFEKPANEWQDYLYPTYPLPSMKGYYYTIIEGHVRNNLIKENIASYLTHQEISQ